MSLRLRLHPSLPQPFRLTPRLLLLLLLLLQGWGGFMQGKDMSRQVYRCGRLSVWGPQ